MIVRPRDPARMLPKAQGLQYTFIPRQRVAAVCELCLRETRGWIITTIAADDHARRSIILCKGCAR